MQPRTTRLAITGGAVAMVIGTLYGTGLIGRPVQNSFGGAFRANGTLLTPAGTAFAIWGVIYLGLAAFVVWLWLGEAAARTRIRAIAVPAALSLVLNGLWLAVVQFSSTGGAGLWLSVAVIIALEASLTWVMLGLSDAPPTDPVEAAVVDVPFGLYFGWTSIAVVANVTAALVAQGLAPEPIAAQAIAVMVLAVALLLGVRFTIRFGGRISVAAAMAWGLSWIAVGRFVGETSSTVVGVVAALAAAGVLASAAVVRYRTVRPALG